MPEYTPVQPRGGGVFLTGPGSPQYMINGLYQPCGPAGFERRLEAVETFVDGSTPPQDLTLQTYQEWAELNWKVPHGTYEAVLRFKQKHWEETGLELVEAEHELRQSHSQGLEVSDSDFRSEAGDALWTSTAIASNGGIDLTQAVRLYLRDNYRHPMPTGNITFGELSEMLAESEKLEKHIPLLVSEPGFLPRDFDPEDYEEEIDSYLRWFGFTAGAIQDRQFGYNDAFDFKLMQNWVKELTDTSGYLAETVIQKMAYVLQHEGSKPGALEVRNQIIEMWFRRIGNSLLSPVIGKGVVYLDYVCSNHGVNLGEVAVENIRKISGRVATNTVDKADGPRDNKIHAD